MEDVAQQQQQRGRGVDLLLAHCCILEERRRRPPARDRLEAAVGEELAERLVGALTGGLRRRSHASLSV